MCDFCWFFRRPLDGSEPLQTTRRNPYRQTLFYGEKNRFLKKRPVFMRIGKHGSHAKLHTHSSHNIHTRESSGRRWMGGIFSVSRNR